MNEDCLPFIHDLNDYENFSNQRPKSKIARAKVKFVCSLCGKISTKLFMSLKKDFVCSKCKTKISHQNPETIEKRKNTMLQKYGVDSASKVEAFRRKTENTCLLRYGAKTPLSNCEIRKKAKNTKKQKYKNGEYDIEKARRTCLEKYGVEHPTKNKKVKSKFKETMLQKYGVENALQNDYFKQKAKVTKLEKYGNVNFNNAEKAKSTRLKKYGYEYSLQSPLIQAKIQKRYFYDGLSFDSQPEIEVYKFCLANNLKVKYHPCSFDYIDSLDKKHTYFPDFEIEGKLYEVKGNHLWKDGHIWFPYRNTLSEQELKEIDARDLAKTECMKANNVQILFTSNLPEQFRKIF